MTTNAILLPRLARPAGGGGPQAAQHPRGHVPPRAPQEDHALRHAGGDPGRHRRRRGGGPPPIKINVVVTRDYNDMDVVDMARRALDAGLARALHRADAAGRRRGRARWPSRSSCPARETRERIEAELGPLVAAARANPSDESRNYRFADGPRRRGVHQPRERAVLRHLQPHAPDRGRQVPPLPAERRRDGRQEGAALGRGRGGRGGHPGPGRGRSSRPATGWTKASPPRSARCSSSAGSADLP